MFKNDKTYFNILRCEDDNIFKLCLAIFQHHAYEGQAI